MNKTKIHSDTSKKDPGEPFLQKDIFTIYRIKYYNHKHRRDDVYVQQNLCRSNQNIS